MKSVTQGVLNPTMRSVFLFAGLFAAATAIGPKIQDPGELALVLNEEVFEDHLDSWIEQEQSRSPSPPAQPAARRGCTFRINGDLALRQPVYLRGGNRFLAANGNTGQIQLNAGEQVVIACTGTGRSILHPNIAATRDIATATCENNNLVSGAGWMNGHGPFGLLSCNAHATPMAQLTTDLCWNRNQVIRVGFSVNNVFYPLYGSCFDQNRKEVLYVWYDQTPEHAIHQTGVRRPTWQTGNFYDGIDVNRMYTQVNQRAAVTHYLQNATLANMYITSTGQRFLARGHLAAKSDYVFATGQRATFYFINVAPQWQSINAGNWNWLEQSLRARIGAAGYNTVVYTGTFGVLKLSDNQRLVDIYLVPQGNRIPVPLYFYKVVYDSSSRRGTAFITINNPHYTLAEARQLEFCTDRCRNNRDFSWLRWHPDSVDIGYSFCCTIDNFRATIPHLPAFPTNGLLF